MVSGHKKGSPYIAKVADKRMGSKISPCTSVPLVSVAFDLNFFYSTVTSIKNYLTTTCGCKASLNSSFFSFN